MNAPIVSFNHVGKTFEVDGAALEAIRDFNVQIAEGEFVAIVGSSGCGKSTLLRLLVGLDTDFHGTIEVDGKPVTGVGSERGIVFQEHRLFPWLSVEDNIGLGLVNEALSPVERRQRVAAFIELVGLTDFARALPHQLSGGQCQRILIAMAFSGDPELIVADEPTTALDVVTQAQIIRVLREVQRRHNTAVILVTHDLRMCIYVQTFC